ncbi:LuxR C-terminal-related transcriptional regulator [Lentzea roselyniae]|uniref:LuxR C-terminal-related transcriptional regulator n=1 Tax=Lentzea roselyniae TaxID=531940 RepID=A0ABP7C788_9PSEU
MTVEHPTTESPTGPLAANVVGRRREIDRVSRALDAAAEHKFSLLMFEGPLGVGKSTLLDAAAEVAAARGFHGASALLAPEGSGSPLHVVHRLLDDVLMNVPGDVVETVVSVAKAQGFDLVPWLTEAQPPTGQDDRRVFASLARVVGALTARVPLCFVIDDLQCADASSLRWLSYLAERRLRLPVVFLLGRTAGAPVEHALALAELGMAAERVRVDGFGLGDTESFLRRVLRTEPEPEFVSTCARLTGGIPLLLRWCAVPSAEDFAVCGTPELGMAVLARLNRHSSELVRLVKVLAVLETPTLELSAAVTGLTAPAARDAVVHLVGLGLLADDVSIAFAHPVVRDSIAATVSHLEADGMHARAARHLHEASAPDLVIARHAVRTHARLGVGIAEALLRAADLPLTDRDPALGTAFLTRALREALPPELRRHLLLRLARSEVHRDPRRAAAHLSEALDYVDDPQSMCTIACRLAQILQFEGHYAEAAAVLRRAITDVGAANPAVVAQLRLALHAVVPGRAAEGAMVGDWRRFPGAGRELAALVAGIDATTGEDLVRGREAALVALSRGVNSILHEPHQLVATIDSLIRVDELDSALRHSVEMVDEAQRRGLELLGALGHTLRSRVHRHRGELPEAIANAQLAVADVRRAGGDPRHFTFVYATEALVRALVEAGDLTGAATAADAVGLTGLLPDSWHHACFLHARGVLRMRQGDVEGALVDQLASGERLAVWSGRNPPPRSWRSNAAMAYLRLGREQDARQLAVEGLELARRWQVPSSIARALLTVAAATRGPAAEASLAEAEAVLRGSPARLLHAQVLFALGTHRWQHGRSDLARRDLVLARSLARECGATPLLTAIEDLPADALLPGEAEAPVLPRRASVLLTQQERKVATLVVAGASNDEVARQLDVTRRGVEAHLTNIYRKLGVRRRTQLQSALADFAS